MNRAYFAGRYVRRTLSAAVMVSTTLAAGLANAAGFQGKVTDDQDGSAIIGAMVTARFGDPFQERTVFTDDQGRYVMAGLPAKTGHRVRVRRIGWEDLRSWDHPTAAEGLTDLDLAMSRHSDPAEVAAQLPANHWYGLLLDKLTNEYEREQFVRQCTFVISKATLPPGWCATNRSGKKCSRSWPAWVQGSMQTYARGCRIC